MSASIVHFGDDRFNRLGALRDAGYSVDACATLEQFKLALTSGFPCDALTIAEAEDALIDDAVSIARSASTAPLILFKASTQTYDSSEFNFVVPLLSEPRTWVMKIGDLISEKRASRSSHALRGARSLRELRQTNSNASSRKPRPDHSKPAVDRARGSNDAGSGFLAFNSEQISPKAVKASQFLRSLTPDMLRELETAASVSFCAPGTVLFAEGQIPHEVFLLLEGQVKFFMNASDGKRLTVHIALAGELLGLPSVFTAAPHRASAETIYPSRVACIGCAEFMKFLLIHPKAGQAAARELSETCDQTYTRLRTIGVTPSNRAKLARLILEWAPQGKQTERGIQIHLGLKHGEIAECIGTCRESVTRILRDLQRWQVIELRGSLMTIADLNALEQCADLR
jgi:CRP-like cAMP-binding protein